MHDTLIAIASTLIGGGLFTFIINIINSKSSRNKINAESNKINAEAEQMRSDTMNIANESLQKMIREFVEENRELLNRIDRLQDEVLSQSRKIETLTNRIMNLEKYIINNGLPLPNDD